MKQSFTLDELGQHWSIHPRTVRRLIQRGELKAHKQRGSMRVLSKEIEKFEFFGGSMTNRKPLAQMDFSKALSHFEPYNQAQKKLDELLTQLQLKENELNDLRRQRTMNRVPFDEQAKSLLEGDLAIGLKMTLGLDERGSTVATEIEILKRAVSLQRDRVDDARRKASHRYCEMLEDQWKEEIIQPIVKTLKDLVAVLTRERDLRERMEDAGISASYFPGIALPLGDPREDSSLINLKITEIEKDYDIEA